MNNPQAEMIDKYFEYNLWANTEMVKICSQLTDEQLQTTIEGTAGNIRHTLEHLIGSEFYYLNHLSGELLRNPDEEDWSQKTMEEFLEIAQQSGEKLIEAVSQADPNRRHDRILDIGPYHFFNWTSALQAIYHGIEHRTQIKMMLTKLGIEHPELAAWDFRMEQYP